MLTLHALTTPPLHLILPTCWAEVTTRQYCELEAQQLRSLPARVQYFTGQSVGVTPLLAEAMAFLTTIPLGGSTRPYPHDLGAESYLQAEELRTLLSQQPLHQCFAAVYGIFTARLGLRGPQPYSQQQAASLAEQAFALPITDTYPAVAHCVSELSRLGRKYAVLAEPDTTEAGRRAREAGSDRLAKFSHLGVARHFAEVFGMSIADIYATPYETVLLWLYQDREQAEILDKLYQQAGKA